MTIILDPGHGMSNKRRGVFDPGFVSAGVREADVVMEWANELRGILRSFPHGHKVVRTRIDHSDPAPVGRRAAIARQFGGEIMISLHCNSGGGKPNGTETFYRGGENRAMASALNEAVVEALGTRSRGPKTEKDSQHATLAVMSFQPCFLIELGFLDHAGDRAKMLDAGLRRAACEALAKVMTAATP